MSANGFYILLLDYASCLTYTNYLSAEGKAPKLTPPLFFSAEFQQGPSLQALRCWFCSTVVFLQGSWLGPPTHFPQAIQEPSDDNEF